GARTSAQRRARPADAAGPAARRAGRRRATERREARTGPGAATGPGASEGDAVVADTAAVARPGSAGGRGDNGQLHGHRPAPEGGTMISVSAGVLGVPRRPTTARTSVVIADADPFSRRTVRDALQSAADIVVAADAAHTREALELAAYFQPDVLLAETSIPSGGGVELVRKLSRTAPEPRVALLATH